MTPGAQRPRQLLVVLTCSPRRDGRFLISYRDGPHTLAAISDFEIPVGGNFRISGRDQAGNDIATPNTRP